MHNILITFLAAPRFEAIVVFLPASVFFVVKAGFLTTGVALTTGFLTVSTFAEAGLEFYHLAVNIHSRNNDNLSHLFRTTSLGGFRRCELDLA